MHELYVKFESEADLDAALNALTCAEEDGYIEGSFNVQRMDATNREVTTDGNWD
jgi:hypothetical protein